VETPLISLDFFSNDFPVWLLAAGSLLAGCWLQTALGFGMAVVAAPIIVLIEPAWVPVSLTIAALFLSVLNSWNQKQDIQLRRMLVPFLTRLPGSALGLWLLLQMDSLLLQLSVAVVVLLAVLVSLAGKQFDYTAGRLGLAGFISGITGTTTSVGGPPMALVMQYGEPQVIRANLSIYFSYSCSISLLGYYFTDLLSPQLLFESLTFLPFCLLGFITGIKARPFVDGGHFRPILLGLCTITGLLVLVTVIFNVWQGVEPAATLYNEPPAISEGLIRTD